jgi:hypothetical protein
MSQVEIKTDDVEENSALTENNAVQQQQVTNEPINSFSKTKRLSLVPKRLIASKLDIARLGFEAVVVALLVVFVVHDNNLKNTNKSVNAKLSSYSANPQKLVSEQTQNTISKVGKLMQLPTTDSPQIATVSNLAAAQKESSFFDSAKQGDEVLMYVKSKEAILYRPDTNKIILVAPLNFSGSTTTTTAK